MAVILHRAIRTVQYIKLNFSIEHLRSVPNRKHDRARYVMPSPATPLYVRERNISKWVRRTRYAVLVSNHRKCSESQDTNAHTYATIRRPIREEPTKNRRNSRQNELIFMRVEFVSERSATSRNRATSQLECVIDGSLKYYLLILHTYL